MVDSRSAVAAIIQRSRARGIVRGRGEDEVCSVDHLVRTADVQVGDVVVTSGVGGAFPPGLQVGTIVIARSPKVGVFREAELEPVVEFESLEEVMVVTSRPGEGEEEEKTVQVENQTGTKRRVQDQDQVDKEPEVEVVDESAPEVYEKPVDPEPEPEPAPEVEEAE